MRAVAVGVDLRALDDDDAVLVGRSPARLKVRACGRSGFVVSTPVSMTATPMPAPVYGGQFSCASGFRCSGARDRARAGRKTRAGPWIRIHRGAACTPS
jgi:hypothetical protein